MSCCHKTCFLQLSFELNPAFAFDFAKVFISSTVNSIVCLLFINSFPSLFFFFWVVEELSAVKCVIGSQY